MSDNHLKTPLATSLQAHARGKAADREFAQGRTYPCTVTEVLGSGIVKVSFQVNSGSTTLPQVTMPVACPEYIRYPIQVGDKGVASPADVRLGGQSGLGSGVPDLSRPANLAALRFYWLGSTNWTPPTDPQALELYAPSGVILRDTGGKTTVKVMADGIMINLGGEISIQTNGHDVNITGGGDVLVNGISVVHHTHSDVSSGSATTGEPVE